MVPVHWYRLIRTTAEVPLLCLGDMGDTPVVNVHPLLLHSPSLPTLIEGFSSFTVPQLMDIANFHCIHVGRSPLKSSVLRVLSEHTCAPVCAGAMYAFADLRAIRRPVPNSRTKRATRRRPPSAHPASTSAPRMSVLPAPEEPSEPPAPFPEFCSDDLRKKILFEWQ